MADKQSTELKTGFSPLGMENKIRKPTLIQLQVSLPVRMIISIAVMAILIAFVYFLNIPNPNMILIAGLVLCSALFGFGGGTVAAVIMFFYTLFFFSTGHSFTQFSPENTQKVIVSLIGILSDMLLVCYVKRSEVRAFKEVEELTERLREEAEATKQRLEKELHSLTEVTELMGSMSSLLTNMPAMSFSKDAETGVYLACNQAFAEYAGKKKPEEVVGLTDHQIFDKATADHFVEDDKKALAMDRTYVFFEDVPDAFCSVIRNLQTTKKKYLDGNGRKCLLGMCVDVTETTKAKAEEAANIVREQEEKEREALEAFYKKDVERLSYQATHDELTGLYNRFGYDFILSELDLSTVYLLMVDADDFKSINDNHDHETGDKMLVKIATVLKNNFRSNDCICRIGGDEFVVVMVNTNPSQKAMIKSKLKKVNQELMNTDDGLPPITVSVGIAHGSEASDDIDLLRRADHAMYQLKRNSKSGYQFSDECR